MSYWNRLKSAVGYRTETEHVIIKPVRDAQGRPAKHLEIPETRKVILEGWRSKREVE